MALEVKRIKNYPVNSNSYIIFDKFINNDCIIVDPGAKTCKDLNPIIDGYTLHPVMILLTHEHFDHCWGCNDLQKHYHIPICCSALCSTKVRNHKTNFSVFYSPEDSFDIEGEIQVINDESTFIFNGHSIYSKIVPGHTDSSMVFMCETHLFTGDALINGLKTVTKLPGGSRKKTIESILFFESLKFKDIFVHPGHLDEFYLDECVLEDILK